MDITGNNYYGIIYVPESASYKDIITEYNNITYNKLSTNWTYKIYQF